MTGTGFFIQADVVEGQPEVMMVVEAQHTPRLARLTIRALAAVEPVTASVHLWPTEECRTRRAAKDKVIAV